MKNLVIIPARGGSKRLVGKNIKKLGEYELLGHSIRYAQENKAIVDKIIVSTDDDEIKKTALFYGAEVIDRPVEISGDNTTTIEVMQHVVNTLSETFLNIILLQPTNPLRPKNLLIDAFETYEKGNYDSLMTVTKNEHKLGEITNNKFIPYTYQLGQRSQDLEPLYYENGLLYITKVEEILKGNILGENNYPLIVDHPFQKIDIDTLEDFELAEFYYKKYKK
ncbi:cytidylyltransferase domain-containing protein [Bacteroidota bacterium]